MTDHPFLAFGFKEKKLRTFPIWDRFFRLYTAVKFGRRTIKGVLGSGPPFSQKDEKFGRIAGIYINLT